MANQQFSSQDDRCVVRLRGLPWSATDDEVIEFLDCPVMGNEHGIKRTFTKEGGPSGEVYVELESSADLDKALNKDHTYMGKRYIEVFVSSVKEMEYVLNKSGESQGAPQTRGDFIVRMRGLPYQCTKDEITQFFSGLDIIHNGITLPLDGQGRCSGEAYVEFATQRDADEALTKHKDRIGHRYIEIFKSTRKELQDFGHGNGGGRMGRGRPSPYDRPMRGNRMRGRQTGHSGGGGSGRMMGDGGYGRGYGGDSYYDDYEEDYEWEGQGHGGYGGGRYGSGGGGGRGRNEYRPRGGRNSGYAHRSYTEDSYEDDYYEEEEDDSMGSEYVVHMRGLPFKASDYDIVNFFSPVVPVRVHREHGVDGRMSGEANVEFASYLDAKAAMQKNNESMQHRYIELFYRGGQGRQSYGGGGGGGGGRGHRGGGRGRGRRGNSGYRF